MNISKNNYEVFFIDYYDGNLSAEQVAELFLFLESHPELKEEFESFSNIQLDADFMEFPDRESLKRGEITTANINQHLVASLEGDLTDREDQLLQTFIDKNPQYRRDADLFRKTISSPDLSIVYPDKRSLKKPVPFFVAYRNEIRYGIAAILLLTVMAGTVTVFNRTMEKSAVRVAQQVPVSTDDNSSSAQAQSPRSNDKTGSVISNEAPAVHAEHFMAGNSQKQVVPSKRNDAPVKVIDAGIDEQIQFASAVPVKNIQQEPVSMEIASLPASAPAFAQAPSGAPVEHYMTIWEALRETSEKNFRKAVGKEEEVLAYAEEADQSKLRLVDVVGKGLGKVSNDKVKLESSFDSDKQSNTFKFSLGGFKIEKK